MRVLLVGEAPNPATVRHPKLWLRPDNSGIGHSANRLLKITGYTAQEYLAMFERDNVLRREVTKEKPWRISEARERAREILGGVQPRDMIVGLGRRVATAFTKHEFEIFTWYQLPGGQYFASVPHPSGLNLFWNSPANVEAGRRFFQSLRATVVQQ